MRNINIRIKKLNGMYCLNTVICESLGIIRDFVTFVTVNFSVTWIPSFEVIVQDLIYGSAWKTLKSRTLNIAGKGVPLCPLSVAIL